MKSFIHTNRRSGRLVSAIALVLCVTTSCASSVLAKDGQPAPIGKFMTVTSPIEDVMFGRIRNTALDLQHQAVREKRPAFLILEITPGTSQFHHVQGLAKFLTSAELSHVTTVAWIPETVTGNNVILALGCKEIVMHPDAELGDIGRGKALDPDEQQFVIALVEKRHNPKVNRALALGMMDPATAVIKVTLNVGEDGQEAKETRLVTAAELNRLKEAKIAFVGEPIKEVGDVGLFSGSKARALNVLTTQTSESRRELANTYGLPAETLREDPSTGGTAQARLIRIDGMITPITETFIERQIDRSLASGANLLIFEIDSDGGLVSSSFNLAMAIANLDPKQVRTVAYVPNRAISGAAMIALGCDNIYLRPSARIGDAAPIELGPGQQFEHVPAKLLSIVRNQLAILAKKKQRPLALAEAMADRHLIVYRVTNRETGRIWYMSEAEIHESDGEWIQGPPVPETGEDLLLTIDGTRAHELKLAEPPVEDFEELKQRVGVPANVNLQPVGKTWVDTMIFILNTRSATVALLVVAIACIYLELHLMTGLLGIVSALCFSLFFWSRFLGGTAGWLEVILFLLGLVCLMLEIFVIPGFGVFGLSGGLLVLAAFVMASQTFQNVNPATNISLMSRTIGTLSLSIGCVVLLGMILSRFLPYMPVFNQMILQPPGTSALHPDEPRLRASHSGTADAGRGTAILIGDRGVAVSMLRPAGKAEIGGKFVDVVSDGAFVASGSQVEVVELAGHRVVVRAV